MASKREDAAQAKRDRRLAEAKLKKEWGEEVVGVTESGVPVIKRKLVQRGSMRAGVVPKK